MPTCPFCYQVEALTPSGLQPPCSSRTTEAHCDACKKLTELDTKIAEARQSLLDMQAQRLQILSHVNATHDLLRKRFPVEIFSNIFRQCLPDLETLNNGNNRRLASTPLRLSQVCRQWRTISHSIPSLWNVVALYLTESQVFSIQGIREVVREWIGRSGHHLPLHVILKVEPEADTRERNAEKSLSIFKAIPNHKKRLGYLQVEASKRILRRLQALGGDLSPPGELDLPSRSPSYIVHPKTPYSSLSGKRFCAKTLRLKRILLTDIKVSLKNLTHVDTTSMCYGDIVTLLRYAPNLVSFKSKEIDIHSDGYYERLPRLPKPPSAHRTLEEFHIESGDISTSSVILLAFNFPSLKSLVLSDGTLEADEADWTTLFVALTDHLRRSGSHLQSISINQVVIDFDNSGNYEWFTEAFESMGSSLNHLDASPSDWEEGDDYRLASAIGAALSRVPNLCSIRLYAGKLHWIHALKNLLSASSTITIPKGQQLSITIRSWDLMLDNETESIPSSTLYYHDDECSRLTLADVEMILDVMTHELISTKIIQLSGTFSAEIETDITWDVIVDLSRVLHEWSQ